MAVNRKAPPPNKGRRVSLVRHGDKPVPNVRKSTPVKKQRTAREFYLPRFGDWAGVVGTVLLTIVLGALLGFVMVYSYRLVTTANYFNLRTIGIQNMGEQGQERLGKEEIVLAAGLAGGHNLLALSINSVERRIAVLPWVETVTVRRILPDSVVIAVKERQPVFWTLNQDKMYYADMQGKLIAPVQPENFRTLPILEVEKEALPLADHLAQIMVFIGEISWPAGFEQVAKVRLSASQNVEIFFSGRALHVFVGAEELAANFDRLGHVVADLNKRGELGSVRRIKAQGTNVWVHKIDG